MTDYAAGIITFAVSLTVISVVAGLISLIFTSSAREAMTAIYQVKGFAYPVLPIAILIAGVLFTVSYVNEKFDDSPRKYIKIILPSLALLIVLLSSVAKFLHIR
ncbi:MAG: hypothetical protein WCG02_01590 [Candidatus Taylorbacteria bacterium]